MDVFKTGRCPVLCQGPTVLCWLDIHYVRSEGFYIPSTTGLRGDKVGSRHLWRAGAACRRGLTAESAKKRVCLVMSGCEDW